ncbi:MAG: hypothetical protein EHM41_18455 [Chloroflexi bacterium]|nr:MAG: hypothetical protein EHM41_18455 [Chloroflexota bacterium]
MNTSSTSYTKGQRNKRFIRVLSWIINLVFLIALVWAIFTAIVTGNPLPVWAWLGIVVLFAVAIGLIVTAVVYRGVVSQKGPFDFWPSARVTGELRTETRQVEANGALSVRAEIHFTEGILQLANGAADLMEAEFTYDSADWKPPNIEYSIDPTGPGNLIVNQKATHRPAMRQGRCEWNLHLNGEQLDELNVKFGAGKAELRVGDLNLSRLRIESGVGELIVDLRGEQKRNLEAVIKAGIGETILRLPEQTGVRVHTSINFGNLKQQNMNFDGQAYTNSSYGKSLTNIDINLESAMGKVTIE